jgi:hypothetical protein
MLYTGGHRPARDGENCTGCGGKTGDYENNN